MGFELQMGSRRMALLALSQGIQVLDLGWLKSGGIIMPYIAEKDRKKFAGLLDCF